MPGASRSAGLHLSKYDDPGDRTGAGRMIPEALRFPGQIPDDDWSVLPGGCQMGGTRCVNPAEVEVQIPELQSVRVLCRGHVGYHMLGSASDKRAVRVLVRRLSLSEAS